MSKETFSVYGEDLIGYPIEAIHSALLVLGQRERTQGEKAFPDIGTIRIEIEKSLRAIRGAISGCCNPSCRNGLILSFRERIFRRRDGTVEKYMASTGVRKCPICGGPGWFDAAIEHDRANQSRR